MDGIYKYFDYKKYLSDYFEFQRKEQPFFSLRYVEKRVGIDASNIVKILNNKRELSKSGIIGFIKYLKLNRNEGEYFKYLVLFAKAKSDKDSKKYFKKFLAIKDLDITQVSSDRYEFYLKWYYTVIAAVLYYYPFDGKNYEALGKKVKPAITADEAKSSIELLERLNFIKKNKNGIYEHTDTTITTGDDFHSIAVKTFQQDTIKLAQKSLKEESRNLRDISTVSLTLSATEFDRIKDITAEYKKAVLKTLEDCEKPDRVYQLNIQLFPLTPVDEKGDENV